MQQAGKPLTHREIYKRVAAAQLYTFNAKDPDAVVRSTIRRHCVGLDFPSARPAKFFVIASQSGKNVKYYLRDEKAEDQRPVVQVSAADSLPEEDILRAYLQHKDHSKQTLLQTILAANSAFFEQLVVDLLLRMGYGGNVPGAGLVKGGQNDEGVDGVIKEDRLGLGKIYIQAKRYSTKNVGRPELQQFVGAMEAVQKGVFITTSDFTESARTYAEKQGKDLALINGDMLTDLLIAHRLGVSEIRSFSIYKIDTDYFVEE